MENAQTQMKYCKYCGGQIPADAVICTLCGRQVEVIKQEASATPNIVINNANSNVNQNVNGIAAGNMKDKWAAVLLCLFLGGIGAHKFYEGQIGMGILYLFTVGLFGIGWLVEFIALLMKPNPYYV